MNVDTNVETISETATCCGSVNGDALTESEADELAAALKALADPIRLRLVSIIATSPTGEVCACDLPESLERVVQDEIGKCAITGSGIRLK